MKRTAVMLLGLGLMISVLLGPAAASSARLDPALKKYQEEQKKKLRQEQRDEAAKRKADLNRRLRPYHTLDELYSELEEIAKKYPKLISLESYGKTLEGRDLKVVKISSGGTGKPEILFSGNIHAQELAGAEFCMALIRKLAEGYGPDCDITKLVNGADIYVIPSLNPDGNYKASRAQAQHGFTGFVRKNEHKVDLNRNYPYPADAPSRLNDSAGSKYQWMTSFRGPEPLSEPESKAMIALIEKHHFLISMNYHTTGGMIMFPPGTFPDKTADDELFRKMSEEYQNLQFDKYKVHSEFDLYPTIGSLDDYIYHRYGILPLTIEIGNRAEARALIPRSNTWSPIFWTYNVYYLDQENENLMPGALNLIEWAAKLKAHPELSKWKPEKPDWTGEPPPKVGAGPETELKVGVSK